MPKQSEEENIAECCKHCIRLFFKKAIDTYNRWQPKTIRFLVALFFGLPISGLMFVLITSQIPVNVSDNINFKIVDTFRCLHQVEKYDMEKFLKKDIWVDWGLNSEMRWGENCGNVSLGDYDKDYNNYYVSFSGIAYLPESVFINGVQQSIEKIPIFANGLLKIPKIQGSRLIYENEKFILTNTTWQTIRIPNKEGELRILGFWTSNGQDMFRVEFTHKISFWDWLIRFVRIQG